MSFDWAKTHGRLLLWYNFDDMPVRYNSTKFKISSSQLAGAEIKLWFNSGHEATEIPSNPLYLSHIKQHHGTVLETLREEEDFTDANI